MHQKKESLEEIRELRRFYLSEYRKDISEFRKKSREYEEYQSVPEKDRDEEKKKFPPILSKANKIRFYFISKEEYFPCLIEQTKKDLEHYEKKLEILSDNLKRCIEKYDGMFCKVLGEIP